MPHDSRNQQVPRLSRPPVGPGVNPNILPGATDSSLHCACSMQSPMRCECAMLSGKSEQLERRIQEHATMHDKPKHEVPRLSRPPVGPGVNPNHLPGATDSSLDVCIEHAEP